MKENNVDYIIIGQGVSGTWLSYYLMKEGMRVKVIDNNDPFSPSRIAAGIINPVTGRRHVAVWMAEDILPFAWDAYASIGKMLDIEAISQKTILDFFPSAQMRASFLERVEEKSPYLHPYPEQNQFNEHFRYDFGCGETRPVYVVNLEELLPNWRAYLQRSGLLEESHFEIDKLEVKEGHVRYDNIQAKKIIFCDGNASASNPWFELLPFAPNKGEALIIEIPGLPPHHIYKKGMMLVPLQKKDHWWVGSNYMWEFDNPDRTPDFLKRTTELLDQWLKIPYTLKNHVAGIRPATIERRPFVGIHPHVQEIGILNGMGTKGCSLAPYFAKQLSDLLIYNNPVSPEADVARFRRILSK